MLQRDKGQILILSSNITDILIGKDVINLNKNPKNIHYSSYTIIIEKLNSNSKIARCKKNNHVMILGSSKTRDWRCDGGACGNEITRSKKSDWPIDILYYTCL